ncbi:LCP family protein [Cellulomonas endophytica]|uniref:LCP family glycopolymer transferase n=1 Tax=Cellulomonas endophytica TaxID=2494735 RepID=UPI0010123266|nr:LCP family protein [Cellulomonas endophytica]
MTSPATTTTATPVRPFTVLVVGTENLYRSQAAELLLRSRLAGDGVRVRSVGTRATHEEPVPPPLAELLAAEGAAVEGLVARTLDAATVSGADLVLTATREERAAVVRLAPTALHRTFTLREFARVARSVPGTALTGDDVAARLASLVAAARTRRAPASPRSADEDDVLDPAAGDDAAYATSLDQVRDAVATIVRALDPGHVAEDPDPSEADAPAPPAPARRRSRTRTVVLAVLVAVLVLVTAVTIGALVVLDRLDDRIARFPDPFAALPSRPAPAAPATPGASDGTPVTILVLGATEDVAEDGPGAWADAASLTDTLMIARVSADRRSAQVVAVPPDLWAQVPGVGPGTLRSALAAGGPTRVVQAVEGLTDVRIDHVALTDAATFARLTETLGGVDLELARDLVVDGRVVAPAGQRRLTGEQALLWVRVGGGEAGRVDRERAWFRAILDRLGDPGVRQDPGLLLELLGVTSDSVTVDEGFDRSEIVGLLTSMRSLRPADVAVLTVPTTTGPDDDGDPVLVPDAVPFGVLVDALRTDTLGDRVGAVES